MPGILNEAMMRLPGFANGGNIQPNAPVSYEWQSVNGVPQLVPTAGTMNQPQSIPGWKPNIAQQQQAEALQGILGQNMPKESTAIDNHIMGTGGIRDIFNTIKDNYATHGSFIDPSRTGAQWQHAGYGQPRTGTVAGDWDGDGDVDVHDVRHRKAAGEFVTSSGVNLSDTSGPFGYIGKQQFVDQAIKQGKLDNIDRDFYADQIAASEAVADDSYDFEDRAGRDSAGNTTNLRTVNW